METTNLHRQSTILLFGTLDYINDNQNLCSIYQQKDKADLFPTLRQIYQQPTETGNRYGGDQNPENLSSYMIMQPHKKTDVMPLLQSVQR